MKVRIAYEDVARMKPGPKQALVNLAEAVEASVELGEMTPVEAGEVVTALARAVERAAVKGVPHFERRADHG